MGKQIKYIKFESSNCMGCKKLTNALLSEGRLDEVQSFNIETDAGWEKAELYGVRSVPVLIKLKNGIEVDRITGFGVSDFKRLMDEL